MFNLLLTICLATNETFDLWAVRFSKYRKVIQIGWMKRQINHNQCKHSKHDDNKKKTDDLIKKAIPEDSIQNLITN